MFRDCSSCGCDIALKARDEDNVFECVWVQYIQQPTNKLQEQRRKQRRNGATIDKESFLVLYCTVLHNRALY
jgi:hypothetical protein